MPTSEQVREWQALRGRFLNALWDAESDGQQFPEVAAALGAAGGQYLPPGDIERLVRTLGEDDLIDTESMGFAEALASQVRLTPAGRAEVERWLTSDEPTPHLPLAASVVFNNYGTVKDAALNLGSSNSTATSTSYHVPAGELADFVDRYRRELLDELGLNDDDREAAEADLDSLEQGSGSGAVQPQRLRPAIRRLLAWAGATAATGATTVGQEEVVSLGHGLLRSLGA